MNLNSDAKIRRFWSESKKSARFFADLLRQGRQIATKWGDGVGTCRDSIKNLPLVLHFRLFCLLL